MAESQSGGMVADFRHLVSEIDLKEEFLVTVTKEKHNHYLFVYFPICVTDLTLI